MEQFLLIVADNLTHKDRTKIMLGTLGYEVEFADDTELALRKLISRRPVLILLKMEMSKPDSNAFTSILKNDHDTSNIRIVALLTNGLKHDYNQMLKSGFDDFVTITSPDSFTQEILNFLTITNILK